LPLWPIWSFIAETSAPLTSKVPSIESIEGHSLAVQELHDAGLSLPVGFLASGFLYYEVIAAVKAGPETVVVAAHDVEVSERVAFVPELFLFVLWHEVHALELADNSADIVLVVEVFCVDAYNSRLFISSGGGDLGPDSESAF
jgi:hypothetical protein